MMRELGTGTIAGGDNIFALYYGFNSTINPSLHPYLLFIKRDTFEINSNSLSSITLAYPSKFLLFTVNETLGLRKIF